MNKNIMIVGGQSGDEAKAACIHRFAKSYEIILRTASSSNAGHTLYHKGKKIVRHLIPSADFSTENKAILGSSMVINPDELLQEVQETLETFPHAGSRIIVDPDAFVVFPHHVEEDKARNAHIGSTNKGVTPAYKDKIGRTGTKIAHLIRDNAPVIQALQSLGVQFKYSLEMYEELRRSKIIFEGSQSILLDLNFGNYPFVTSGECGLSGVHSAGYSFCAPSTVYGIFKPYVTRAGGGEGKFITEFSPEEAEPIAKKGGEIGATTGRPRRIGALNLPALKYAIIKGGITNLILTKVDILDGYKEIKVCTDYDKPIRCGMDLDSATPIYSMLPGWKNSKDTDQLKPFLERIEKYVEVPIDYVSNGVGENDMAKINHCDAASRTIDPFDMG